ncbi:unnamed protein product [Lactuca saligna]|uniref:Nuclear pore complex protein NUP214 n=1 Tax=Lactuca saligna TaxID=75948 RepID=A0AA35Y9P9_LACSI|nr:unnamed protein product [Lactuca saligna]
MAETETADTSKNVIKVEEEIEGDQIGTKNYRFSKIGESVPIKSDADFKFDMDNLPSRPMAVSERFGVIFVAHSSGFCVARTKDVMDSAEELKNGGTGPCIQELSVVDVSVGKISILALSADSSMLAASVGSNLYFFSVEGLLNKDQEPSFSKSINGSSSIKDMQWSPRLKQQYVVLTNDGNLYHAAGQDDLNNLMDNVDAVDWSMDGKFLAVAKYDYLSILSSKFEEKLQIKLLFDSLVDDSAPDSVVKVDSLRWARPDCIILGCYRLNADGKEENYLLQLISVKDGKITKPSSNPVALTFSDAFLAINEDDIPSGSGPHMFVSYVDECEIAFVANRKNTDQHIVLFGWSSDKNNEAEMIEITNDAWVPTINLQENSDDNLILGLAVDKVYKDEKLRLTLGEQDTEVSPCCILLCLTIDAKVFMFHFASATGPSLLSEDATSSVSDEEVESSPISSQNQVMNINKQIEDQTPQKVKVDEQNEKAHSEAHTIRKDEKTNSTSVLQLDKGATQQQVLSSSKDQGQPLFKASEPVKDLKKIENEKVADSVSKNDKSNKTVFGGLESSFNKASSFGLHDSSGSFSSSSNVFGVQSSKASFGLNTSSESHFSSNVFGVQSSSSSSSAHASVNKASFGLNTSSGSSNFSLNAFGMPSSSSSSSSSSSFSSFSGIQRSAESSGKIGSTNLPVSSGTSSSGGMFPSRTFEVKSPFSNTGTGTTPLKLSFPKLPSASSTTTSITSGVNVINTLPVMSTTPPNLGKSLDLRSSDKGNYRSQTQSRMLNSDPNLSEQRSVEEMAKELDTLLDSIQGPGGFYDASVSAHKPSVTALEEGILVLSERCRKWTDTMDHGIEEVQLILDKTVQVLARKIYMEAIVKQATDSQYLDIWNRQKLNSELEMKRRHILQINQNLTNQVIELERHLNTLELQRFGDKGDLETNRRSFHTRHGPPRHVQSLHSLHNTMNAQLAAAEKLSECLSKQMAVLSIETGPTKKQNVKKELFDTIGISYDNSPSQEKSRSVPPKSQLVISSNSSTKKSQQSAVKTSEPETARRRRDSLDRSWASIEPPRTTVKRMLLQEERTSTPPARSSLPPGTRKLDRLSVGPTVSHNMPSETQIMRHSERQLNSSSVWGNNSNSNNNSLDSTKTPVVAASVLSLGSVSHSQSTPVVSQEVEKSKSRFTFNLKSDDPKITQQPPSFLEPSKSPATNIFQKKPLDFSESSNKETEKPKFLVGDTNQKPKVAESSSSIWSKKSQESPFSATSSSTAFSGKSFSLESSSSTKEKQLSEAVSSSVASLSVPVTSTPSSSTPPISFSKPSTSFGIQSGATQTTTPLSAPSSSPSPSPSPSFLSFSSSIKPSANIDLNTSKSKPDTTETPTPIPSLLSLPKFDIKPNESSSTQVSPPTPRGFLSCHK